MSGAKVKNTKIVHLGQVRDLLAEWEKVRASIVAGIVGGFHVGVVKQNGEETLFLGGTCQLDPLSATRAALKSSAARMRLDLHRPQAAQDELPPPPKRKKKA